MANDRTLKIQIRRMCLADVERVHEIDVLSFSLPWPERSFRYELMENPSSRMWVAETGVDGQKVIVGMLGMWLIVDEVHIGTLATHPDYRRLGIASRLMVVALHAAFLEGARLVYLEVRRSNRAAQEMYRKFGFEFSGVRPRYYSDNHEDALLMTLRDLNIKTLENIEKYNG